jgi:hypothetical protein
MKQAVLPVEQVVNNGDLVSRVEQMLAQYRPEITGATGNEDFHLTTPPLILSKIPQEHTHGAICEKLGMPGPFRKWGRQKRQPIHRPSPPTHILETPGSTSPTLQERNPTAMMVEA